jgi:hypothetical protein
MISDGKMAIFQEPVVVIQLEHQFDDVSSMAADPRIFTFSLGNVVDFSTIAGSDNWHPLMMAWTDMSAL